MFGHCSRRNKYNENKIVCGSTWIVFGSDVQDKTIVYCLFMVNKT